METTGDEVIDDVKKQMRKALNGTMPDEVKRRQGVIRWLFRKVAGDAPKSQG